MRPPLIRGLANGLGDHNIASKPEYERCFQAYRHSVSSLEIGPSLSREKIGTRRTCRVVFACLGTGPKRSDERQSDEDLFQFLCDRGNADYRDG